MSDRYPNSGSLSRNDKRQNDKQPEFKGQCLVHCSNCNNHVEFWLSAWVKESKEKGRKFFSLAFKPKQDLGASPDAKRERLKAEVTKATEDGYQPLEDDVPF